MNLVSKIIRKIPDSQFKWKLILNISRWYNNFDIRLAKNDKELNDIFQFRYKIYVEQLKRKQKYVDHKLKIIKEPLDENAFNIGAWRDGKIVGVLRLNMNRNSDLNMYNDLYKISLFNDFQENTSISTKLMVDNQYRKSNLSLLLFMKCYEIACENNLEINFMDCNKHLIKYFLILGYRYYIPEIIHPEYGKVTPLVFVQDKKYIQNIKSPFFPICDKYDIPKKVAEYYNSRFLCFHENKIPN